MPFYSPELSSLSIITHHSSSTSSTLGARSRFPGALPLLLPFLVISVAVEDGAGLVVVRLAPALVVVEEVGFEEEDFFDFFFLVYFFCGKKLVIELNGKYGII